MMYSYKEEDYLETQVKHNNWCFFPLVYCIIDHSTPEDEEDVLGHHLVS